MSQKSVHLHPLPKQTQLVALVPIFCYIAGGSICLGSPPLNRDVSDFHGQFGTMERGRPSKLCSAKTVNCPFQLPPSPPGLLMAGIPPNINLIETFQHEELIRYFTVAAAALVSYDVLINLDVEVKYIWATFHPRNRPVKLGSMIFNSMYLVQRYLPLFDRVLLDQYWTAVVGILLSELILALRIWAVWGRRTSIGVILLIMLIGGSIVAMVFIERFVRGIDCFMKNRDIYVCWMMLMIYDSGTKGCLRRDYKETDIIEASFLVLMGIPGFWACKSLDVFIASVRKGGSSQLMKVIYRDAVTLINIFIIFILPSDLIIVIAAHAILHIREVGSRDHIRGIDTLTVIMTTRDFPTENVECVVFASNAFRTIGEPEDLSQSIPEGLSRK
ncbi:hypothetical protein L218DRAFT_949698 [Marasmius fiardii PR-910]|nr:hypothetical protein L218DRAFT_949698 [Marasmius fiardii PR-910]